MRRLSKDEKIENGFRQRMSKTLIAAFVVLGIVVWQVVQISNGDGLSFLQGEKAQARPTKWHTKRESRDFKKLRAPADPVTAFVERAKRGMTEQEIRWMIAEFEAMGPMPTSGDIEQLRKFRQHQHDWYLAAMTEALSLTPQQKQAGHALLLKQLEQRIEAFQESTHSEDGKTIHPLIIQTYFEPNLTFRSAELAPWDLLDLTEDQSKLTNKILWQKRNNAAKNSPYPFNQEQPWISHRSLAMHEVEMGQIVSYPPPSNYDLRCTMYGTISGGIIDISEAFPLTPDQNLADHRQDIVSQARMLHPAQLRLALLLNPGVHQLLKTELDKPQE